MLLIGITGLIGSGKSYICDIFENKGVPVFYCDDEAKSLYEEYSELREYIFDLFDCNTDGKVDRKKLGSIVFKDKYKLNQLTTLIHPYFKDKFQKWVHNKRIEGYKFVLVENAIMFNSDFYKSFDLIIGITNHKEVRIQQTIARDNCTREQVLDRMDKQLSETELYTKCDIVLHSGYNDGRLNDIVEDLIYNFKMM